VIVYWLQRGERPYRAESAILIFATIVAVVSLFQEPDQPNTFEVADPSPFILASCIWASIMLPIINYPFLSDDYVFAARTTFQQALASQHFFRPLFSVLFLALYRLGDGSPWVFHGVAFALHVTAGFLVSVIGRKLSDNAGVGWVAGALFLLSPLQPEATLWVSGIQDLLWTTFGLAAIVVCTEAPRLTVSRTACVILFFAAALLSKETAVCIPLLIITSDFKVFGLATLRARIGLYSSLAAVLAGYVVLWSRSAAAAAGEAWPHLSRYFVKQFLATTFGTLALPWNMEIFGRPSFVIGLVGILLCGGAFRLSTRKPRLLLAGALLVLAAVLPLGGYLFVGRDLAGTRYLYGANVGWAILTGALVISVGRSVAATRAAAGVAIATLSILLLMNLRPWRTVADLMHDMERSSDSSDAVIRNWILTAPCTVHFTPEGRPDRCGGVYIFRNGYSEFVRIRKRGE
jgi:hypothetical protein